MITRLKNVIHDIKEKTQGMTASEKISYCWEYYLVEAMFAAFFLFLILSLGGSIINNALQDPVIKIGVLKDVEIVCGSDLDDLLAEAFPDASGRKAPLKYDFDSPTDTDTNMYAAVQLAAYLSAGELDCGILNEDALSYVKESGRPMKVFNISNTAIGTKMAQYDVKPLYYFYFEDTGHANAAAALQNYLCR